MSGPTSEHGATIVQMEEGFELPDRRKVQITKRGLETVDHDDCPFCRGRAAAHRGDGEECNPFPKPDFDIRDNRSGWYETDYGLWLAGHGVGSIEPGGLLWYENPTLDRRP